MKKFAVLLTATLAVVACSNDSVGPTEDLSAFDASAIVAYDPGGLSAPGHFLVRLHRLPAELKLTAAQEAAIKSMVERFVAAIRPDVEALAAIHKRAEEARRAGRPREEIARILAEGDRIRARLEEAEEALAAAIQSVLTPAQKAWLAAHEPQRCNPRTAPPLTDAQRTQIRALIADYEAANRADLDAVRAGLERARLAHKNGATREQIKAILDSIKPAVERLARAQATLLAAIQNVLTPEQRASGCYRGLPAPSVGPGR